MSLSNRSTVALLGALISLNILLRYPTTGHEVDVDSFFIHALTGALITDSHAKWTITPLSYFGWYPLSYPSAGPFLLASISMLSGQNLEGTILVMTIVLGPLGILGAFLMSREVRANNVLAISAAMLYGLAPRFLSITLWTASTRNLFTALLPILIWAILRSYRKGKASTVLVLILSSITLAATHRLVVLLLVAIVAFFAAVLVRTLLHLMRIRFPSIVLRGSVRRAMPHVALVAVVVSAAVSLFGTNVLDQYSTGELLSGSNLATQLANLSISIARSAGLALPLTFVGVVVLTQQRNKTIAEPFLAIALIGLVPTLFLRQYTGFYILPFLAIFGGLGILGLLNGVRKRPRIAAVLAVALVVGIAGFSTLVLGIETRRIPVLDSETYTTGLYVGAMGAPGSMIANDGFTGVRVAAIAGVRVLPVGGAGTTFQNPELLAYEFYNSTEVNERLVQVPVSELTIESDSLWVVPGIQAELDWTRILQSAIWEIPSNLNSRYAPAYYLESNEISGSFFAYNNVYCSNLARSAHESAYLIYDNGIQSIYWLRWPGRTAQQGGVFPRCP